jgi:hypothetical protein
VSIYATWFFLHGDDRDPENDLGPPWIYRGSHILPAESDPRGGVVALSAIPNHITRDGRDDGGPGLHDWLLVSLNDADAILNREQAERMRDVLTAWLDRPVGPG